MSSSLSSYPGSSVAEEADQLMRSPGSPRALDDDDDDDGEEPTTMLHRVSLSLSANRMSSSAVNPSHSPHVNQILSDANPVGASPGSVSAAAPTLSSWSSPVALEPAALGYTPLLEDQSAAQVVDRLRWWRTCRVKEQPLPVEHYVFGRHYLNYSSFGSRPLSCHVVRSLRNAAATVEAAGGSREEDRGHREGTVTPGGRTPPPPFPTVAASSTALAQTRSPSLCSRTATEASAQAEVALPSPPRGDRRTDPPSPTAEERDLASHKRVSCGHDRGGRHPQRERKPRGRRARRGTASASSAPTPTPEALETTRRSKVQRAAMLLSLFKPRAASAPRCSRVVRKAARPPPTLANAGRAADSAHHDYTAAASPTTVAAAGTGLTNDPLSQRLMAIVGSPNVWPTPLMPLTASPYTQTPSAGLDHRPPFSSSSPATAAVVSDDHPRDPLGLELPLANTACAPSAVVLHNPPRLVLYSRHMAPERAVVAARVTSLDVESSELMTDRPEVFGLSNLPLFPFEKHFYAQQLRDISLDRLRREMGQQQQPPPPLASCGSAMSSGLGSSPVQPAEPDVGGRGATTAGSPLARYEEAKRGAWPTAGQRKRYLRLRAASLPALPSTTPIHRALQQHRRSSAMGEPSLLHGASAAARVKTTMPAAATRRYPFSATMPDSIVKRVDDLQEVYCFNPLTDCIGTGAFSQVYAAIPILRGSEDDEMLSGSAACFEELGSGMRQQRETDRETTTTPSVADAALATTTATTTGEGRPLSVAKPRRSRRAVVVAIKVIARKPKKKKEDFFAAATRAPAALPSTRPEEKLRVGAVPPAAAAEAAGRLPDSSQRRELVEIEREISILRRLRHTGCSRFYEAVRTPESFVISMKMHKGSMDARRFLSRFGPPSEARAALMLFQLMDTVNYLHNEFGLLHRDIKLENLLVSLIDVPEDRVQQVLGPDVNKPGRGHCNAYVPSGGGGDVAGPRDEGVKVDSAMVAAAQQQQQQQRRRKRAEERAAAAAAAQCRSLGWAPVHTATQMLRVTLIDFGLARRTRNHSQANASSDRVHRGVPSSSSPSQRGVGFTNSPPTPLTAGGGGRQSVSPAMPKSASRLGMPSPMPSTANMLLRYYDVEDEDVEEEDDDPDDGGDVLVESDNSELSSDGCDSDVSSIADEDSDDDSDEVADEMMRRGRSNTTAASCQPGRREGEEGGGLRAYDQRRAKGPPALSTQRIAEQQQQLLSSPHAVRSRGSSILATPQQHVSLPHTITAGPVSTSSATNSRAPVGALRSPGNTNTHVPRTRKDDDDNVTLLLTPCGTERYLPPEMLEWIVAHGWTRRPTTAALAKQMDMYAIGTVAYVLLSGCFPFNATSRATLVQQQRRVPRCNSERWDGVSATAIGFVQGLLDPDPEKRMTAREALKHPFLAEAAAIAGKLGLVPHTYGSGSGTAPSTRASEASSSLGRPPLSQTQPHNCSPTHAVPRPSMPLATKATRLTSSPSGMGHSIDAYTEAFLKIMGGDDGEELAASEGASRQHSLSVPQQEVRANHGSASLPHGLPVGTERGEAGADDSAAEFSPHAEPAVSITAITVNRQGSTEAEEEREARRQRQESILKQRTSSVDPALAAATAEAAPARQRRLPPPPPLATVASEPSTSPKGGDRSGVDLFDQLYHDIMSD